MDELEPQLTEESVVEWLKDEMRRGLLKTVCEDVYGPALYGDGNFEVYQNELGEWDVRPIEGWKPAKLTGLLYFKKE